MTPSRRRPRLDRHVLRYVYPAVALLVALAGGGIAAVESDTVGSLGDGIWWALSLVTTVGFVHGTPTTTAGKVIAGVLMVVGFALLSLTTAAVASLFVREDESAGDARDAAFEGAVLEQLRALRERIDELDARRAR